jgi:hypothetical protein
MNLLSTIRNFAASALPSLILFLASVTLYTIFAITYPVEPLFSIINYTIAFSALAWIFVLDPAPTSLRQIFFLCAFIFYAIAPRIELSTGTTYWSGSTNIFDFCPTVSLLVLVGMWVFALSFSSGCYSRLRAPRRVDDFLQYDPSLTP